MDAKDTAREIKTFAVAVYVIVDKANNRTGIAVTSSDEFELIKDVDCEFSYMQLGLTGLMRALEVKIDSMVASKDTGPIDINFCTNNANLAKAVTRAFIMARKLYSEGIDPITELRRRGKDIDAYLPLINVIAKLYETCKGVRQIGHVGTKAKWFPVYYKALNHVRSLKIKVNGKTIEGDCTALSNKDVARL